MNNITQMFLLSATGAGSGSGSGTILFTLVYIIIFIAIIGGGIYFFTKSLPNLIKNITKAYYEGKYESENKKNR